MMTYVDSLPPWSNSSKMSLADVLRKTVEASLKKSKQTKSSDVDSSNLASFYYCIVRNIPFQLRSCHLREFFAEFVEKKKFHCFHYKHRPEVLISKNDGSVSKHKTCCVVVGFKSNGVRHSFMRKYNGKYWHLQDCDNFKYKCTIQLVNVGQCDGAESSKAFLTRKEEKWQRKHHDDEMVTLEQLSKLSELRPPCRILPNGNVGTPSQVLMELIRDCQLPPKLIKTLGIKGTFRQDSYTRVAFNYNIGCYPPPPPDPSFAASIQEEDDEEGEEDKETVNRRTYHYRKSPSPEERMSDDEDDDDDDNRGESWELHEALTNDVTAQERDKERLFEENIELKWEKGGSGLVFYTDAQYWAEEDGDFDEQTADNFGVDMQEFYGGDGDRDARDFMRICEEKRLRNGEELHPNSGSSGCKGQFGGFERHTKAIGRRIMTKCGWDDSKPTLGRARTTALIHPLDHSNGQMSRRGFGYRGEKLHLVAAAAAGASAPGQTRHLDPIPHRLLTYSEGIGDKSRRRKERRTLVPGDDHLVMTSVYDPPLDIDLPCDVTRSMLPTALKRRREEEEKVEESSIPARTEHGSKLVRRERWWMTSRECDDDDDVGMGEGSLEDRLSAASSAIRFVPASSEAESCC